MLTSICYLDQLFWDRSIKVTTTEWVRHPCCDSLEASKQALLDLIAQFPFDEHKALCEDLPFEEIWTIRTAMAFCLRRFFYTSMSWEEIVLYTLDGTDVSLFSNSRSLALITNLSMKLLPKDLFLLYKMGLRRFSVPRFYAHHQVNNGEFAFKKILNLSNYILEAD